MKTGIAVLGAGRWGVHLIRNFLALPQARVVAVVDPHPERLAACRERLGLDESVYLATDWESAIQMPDVEAVAIATPAATHYTLIVAALHQGLHVLAEKPLTLDAAEALELCRLAEQQQRQLMVDHTYLFHPAVARGKEIIHSGIMGNLRYGYASRTHLGPVRSDVDALWDLAVHDINIFNTWLGQMPFQVQATGRVWLQGESGSPEFGVQSPQSGESGRGEGGETLQSKIQNPKSKIEQSPISDLVMITLTYPDGFQAFIHLCWLNPDKQRRLSVVGNKGTLIFDELQPTPLTIQKGYFELGSAGDYTPTGLSSEVIELKSQEPLAQVCDRFLSSVRQNTPDQISSGWVGATLVQILCCCQQSLQQGGIPVKIPPATS